MDVKLTTLTQFGARLGMAKLHINALLRSCSPSGSAVNHIFYLVDPENRKLHDYLERVANENSNVYFYTRLDNDFTPFKRLQKKAPYGGDCNYDFLIRRPQVGELFLTLHDDSIIVADNLMETVLRLKGDSDFAGFKDTRIIPTYQNIEYEGVSMVDLRLGTWFTIGTKKEMLSNNYLLGDYRNYWKYFLHLRYKFDQRLKFKAQKIWLNGGFDLNIRGRIENKKFRVYDLDEGIAEHFEKITGFFAASHRDMLKFADSDIEVARWSEYFSNLRALGRYDSEDHDRNFLLSLARKFEAAGVSDDLLNTEVINSLGVTG